MRLKTLAVAAGVLLVAALAATAIVIHYLDPRSLAESLAASVKADTGREVSFGTVEVTFLPMLRTGFPAQTAALPGPNAGGRAEARRARLR